MSHRNSPSVRPRPHLEIRQLLIFVWFLVLSACGGSDVNARFQPPEEWRGGTAFPRNITGAPHPCQGNGTKIKSDEEFAILSSSISSSAFDSALINATRAVTPCRTWINVKSTEENESPLLTLRVFGFCRNCASNSIILTIPLFAQIHPYLSGTIRHDPVNVKWLIMAENGGESTSQPSKPKQATSNSSIVATNAPVHALFNDRRMRDLMGEYMKKNTLRKNESCNYTKEEQRRAIMEADPPIVPLNDTAAALAVYGTVLLSALESVVQIPGAFCNSYQNLACSPLSERCACVIKVLPVEGCITDIQTKRHMCLLDETSRPFGRLGQRLPRPTNECWVHHLCELTRAGERCVQEYRKQLTNLTRADPYARNSTMYLIRFPSATAASLDKDTADCSCMDPDMLYGLSFANAMITRQLINLTRLTVLEYGSKCDHGLETLRTKHLSQLRALDGRINAEVLRAGSYVKLDTDFSLRKQVIYGLSALLQSNGQFCKTNKRLVCGGDGGDGRCVCYNSQAEAVEMVRDEVTGACVLTKGSICDPAFWRGRLEVYTNPYEEDAEPPACANEEPCIEWQTGTQYSRGNTTAFLSYKDKLFPYLLSSFVGLETDVVTYCRCGHPPLDYMGLLFVVVPVILLVLALAPAFAVWHKRTLRAVEEKIYFDGDPNLVSSLDEKAYKAFYKPLDLKGSIKAHEIMYDDPRVVLGVGHFGKVEKARVTINGVERVVAVKSSVMGSNGARTLRAELKILQHIGTHANVVEMVAFVPTYETPLLLIEFCEGGSLDKLLQHARAKNLFVHQVNDFIDGEPNGDLETICIQDLYIWSEQIATGMEYLGTMNVLHGDLFAKNVVIKSRIAKITDFGLSRRFDEGGMPVPTRRPWILPPQLLPPEARTVHARSFPSDSIGRIAQRISRALACKWLDKVPQIMYIDIWTFGILLWEIFNLGLELPHIKRATDLEQPEYGSPEVYSVMLKCWERDPHARPTFTQLRHTFGSLTTAENVSKALQEEIGFIDE